jgi:hypothetical protein
MFDWVNDLWAWVVALFTAFKDYLLDLPLKILDGVLDAIATSIESIQPPDLLSSFSIGSILSALPSGVLYFLDQSGLNDGMVLLLSGFSFRMIRKAVTFFQW